MEHLRLLFQELKDDPTRDWLLAYATAGAKGLPKTVPRWCVNRVPIVRWIPKYEWRWSIGDFIAGLTVGLMLVPQSIAYAGVATLPVQYGLFSSYVAPILYTFTGTSKDLTIGPTAVVSLLTGEIIKQLPNDDPVTVAIATAFMVGLYAIALGVLRLGIILDFFPGGVLTGYTSGAALTIAVQQLPKLLGEYHVTTSSKTGTIIHNVFASLGSAHWRDILFALSSIIALVGLQTVGKRYGSRYKAIWFISVARNTFVVIIFTAISCGINKGKTKGTASISIIGSVPSGLYKPSVPDTGLLATLAGKSITIFLAAVLEHMAIGKAFARKEKYQLDLNQELFSIGLVNIVGSFFGAFAVTGSFSRTAVNNASGSRSPLSGLMCAVVVIISVCAVTPAFFYISNATLGAVIFLAVIQLVAGPRTWYQLWRLSFWDFLGGMLAFWVTLFVSVEIGIYTSVGFSLVVLLWRVARPSIKLLAEVIEDPMTGEKLNGVYVDARDPTFQTRAIQPLPGVLVLRLEESLTFPNSRYIKSQIVKQIFAYTNGGDNRVEKKNWNSNQSEQILKIRKHYGTAMRSEGLPKLRGLILDFSAVNNLDSTGLQTLFDLRSELQDFAGSSNAFEMHFVCVHQSVLRIMRLADIANPVDRPERAVPRSSNAMLPLVRGDTRPSVPRLRSDYSRLHSPSRNKQSSDSGLSLRKARSRSPDDQRRYEASDNAFRANDPAPLAAEGMGPILDPSQANEDGLHGHAAFLDPENDKFLIHLSITQAIKVLSQRLHLSEQRDLEEATRPNNGGSSEGSGGQSTLNEDVETKPHIPDSGERAATSGSSSLSEEPLAEITGEDGLRLDD